METLFLNLLLISFAVSIASRAYSKEYLEESPVRYAEINVNLDSGDLPTRYVMA
jgi:hypothetical protein